MSPKSMASGMGYCVVSDESCLAQDTFEADSAANCLARYVGQSLSNKSGVARLTSLHPVRIMPALSSSKDVQHVSYPCFAGRPQWIGPRPP
jgi:hypothetical protein